ncbi:MAG: hypothetical protein JWP58_4046 [Hymenobacter sp.]|nr:hypothetical protein [Hymenobacter sp.]
MYLSNMETQQLLSEIATLPPTARQELEQFLMELKLRYARQNSLTPDERTRWMNPEFFGMHADREDMADSDAYIRKLRDEQWPAK